MKNLANRITEVSKHLQTLSKPEYCSTVEEAVARKDEKALLEVCVKANIPRAYRGTILSVIQSINPKKYPMEF